MADRESERLESSLRGRAISAAEYARLARKIEEGEGSGHWVGLRVAVLGSYTMDFIRPYLVVEGARRGYRLELYFGPFGQFEQQLSDPSSRLYDFDPQVLVLQMRPEDVDPDLFPRFYSGDGRSNSLGRVVHRLAGCVERFRSESPAPVLTANFAQPAHMPLGPFDANDAGSLTYALAGANQELRERLSHVPAAALWDYAGLVGRSGAGSWTDPRLQALARMPVAADKQPLLASDLARAISAAVRPAAKCLVLDLDNTLWGGVIGDDGLEGIQLGDDYPGKAFKDFQRSVLGLTDRGILLAVVSKNDREVAEEALRDHPEMLIRPEHLSASRINWEPKSRNLRAIADELNLGSDALVLFDDNPVERAEVEANAPEVLVVDVPSDPLLYDRALHECGFFDTLAISTEDRRRVEMYRQERRREEQRESAATVDEFLTGLEMVAEVGVVDQTTIGRVSQLVGKTNQFNLTTRRHTQGEIAEMCAASSHTLLYLRLADSFGDLGLIAVGILEHGGDDAVIDSFVMSCRAMGRQAEVALISELVRIAREEGASRIVADYLPTERNRIVADLYPSLGFREDGPTHEGGTRFSMDLSAGSVEWPTVITRSGEPERSATTA